MSVGAFAIEVQLSPWLLLCTLFIALFLGLCKRRHERASLGEDAVKHRALLASYSLPFLDQLILITASVYAVLGSRLFVWLHAVALLSFFGWHERRVPSAHTAQLAMDQGCKAAKEILLPFIVISR